MAEKICTFAGHRDVFGSGNLGSRVYLELKRLVRNEGVTCVLSGGMGGFDALCEGRVRELKREFPQIRLQWVIPYITKDFRQNESYFRAQYDDILYPLPGVYYKNAIWRRNCWMVDQADFLLAYICRPQSGAFQTLRYARRQDISIINLGTRDR